MIYFFQAKSFDKILDRKTCEMGALLKYATILFPFVLACTFKGRSLEMQMQLYYSCANAVRGSYTILLKFPPRCLLSPFHSGILKALVHLVIPAHSGILTLSRVLNLLHLQQRIHEEVINLNCNFRPSLCPILHSLDY